MGPLYSIDPFVVVAPWRACPPEDPPSLIYMNPFELSHKVNLPLLF